MPKHKAGDLGRDSVLLVTHNAHVGSSLATMRRFLKSEIRKSRRKYGRKPDAIGLQEVPHLYRSLPSLAKEFGYTVQQDKPGNRNLPTIPEAGSSALLVSTDHKVRRDWTAHTREQWTVVSGRGGRPTRHTPREFPVALVDLSYGWTIKLGVIHFPTNGPGGVNSRAWHNNADRGARIASSSPELPVVLMGDSNATLAEVKRRLPAADVTGARIDHGIGWRIRLRSTVGPKYKSAGHPAVRIIGTPGP